jgi:hypothetical protein
MLASSVVDRGFELRLGQTKDYKIGNCCFSAIKGEWRFLWKFYKHVYILLILNFPQNMQAAIFPS